MKNENIFTWSQRFSFLEAFIYIFFHFPANSLSVLIANPPTRLWFHYKANLRPGPRFLLSYYIATSRQGFCESSPRGLQCNALLVMNEAELRELRDKRVEKLCHIRSIYPAHSIQNILYIQNNWILCAVYGCGVRESVGTNYPTLDKGYCKSDESYHGHAFWTLKKKKFDQLYIMCDHFRPVGLWRWLVQS